MSEPSQHHREFTIERVYPNCRAHVWAAWSIPEKKAAWMGGDREMEADFRPGGNESRRFRSERGLHENSSRYFEIKEEERIILAYSMALEGRVHSVSLVTITFQDENGGTKLLYTEQMCVIPPSDSSDGRKQGWTALLDKLADYLASDTRQ